MCECECALASGLSSIHGVWYFVIFESEQHLDVGVASHYPSVKAIAVFHHEVSLVVLIIMKKGNSDMSDILVREECILFVKYKYCHVTMIYQL